MNALYPPVRCLALALVQPLPELHLPPSAAPLAQQCSVPPVSRGRTVLLMSRTRWHNATPTDFDPKKRHMWAEMKSAEVASRIAAILLRLRCAYLRHRFQGQERKATCAPCSAVFALAMSYSARAEVASLRICMMSFLAPLSASLAAAASTC